MAANPASITVVTSRPFSFLWLRRITGGTLAGQRCCAQTLRGPYHPAFTSGYTKANTHIVAELTDVGIWYLCGVSSGKNAWHRNVHLLLSVSTPLAESCFSFVDEGLTAAVVGADLLPIPPLPMALRQRLETKGENRRANCRCIHAAYSLYPTARAELLEHLSDGDKGS